MMQILCVDQPSLVLRPEEEKDKGPGFSSLRICLIAVEVHGLHIQLTHFHTFLMPDFDTKCYTLRRGNIL